MYTGMTSGIFPPNAVACFATSSHRTMLEYNFQDMASTCLIINFTFNYHHADVTSGDGVRHWCDMFRSGHTNVHDEEKSGRPGIMDAELIQLVDERVRETCRFTISELCDHFPQICHTLLFKVITEDLGYWKFCARWVPKTLF